MNTSRTAQVGSNSLGASASGAFSEALRLEYQAREFWSQRVDHCRKVCSTQGIAEAIAHVKLHTNRILKMELG